MIDTTALNLKSEMFKIFDYDKFSPSASGIYNSTYRLGGRGNMKCVQNNTPRELKSGIYKPNLTLTKRLINNKSGEFEIKLRIQFSIPKLLFGNNFDELTGQEFYETTAVLQQKLEDMGVSVSESALITAPVSMAHFSKNFPLTDYSIPQTYIRELSKLDVNKKLDLNKTDFRNGGESIKYRANTFEIVFYDKIKELEHAILSEERTEKQDNAIQTHMLEILKKINPFEVLRMEARLNTTRKIKQIFRKAGIDEKPIFTNVFNKETSKKVLLYYMDEIESEYLPLFMLGQDESESFFADYLMENPTGRLATALEMTGLKILLEKMGVRGFRQAIKRYGDNAWYNLNRKTKKLTGTKKVDVFSTLRKELTDFKPLKIVDFQDKMINNDKYN